MGSNIPVIITGDFNARIGTSWMPVMPYVCNNNVRHNSCDSTMNDRGRKLSSFACASYW
jgi:hypothetical protein